MANKSSTPLAEGAKLMEAAMSEQDGADDIETFAIQKSEEMVGRCGPFGRYQWVYIIMVQLFSVCFCGNFSFLSFAKLDPVVTCPADVESFSNQTSGKICEQITACPNYTLAKPDGFHSLSFEWFYLISDYCVGTTTSANPLLTLLSVSMLVSGICVFPAVFLSDIVGRKRIILAGLTIMIIFGLSTTLATTFWLCGLLYNLCLIGGTMAALSIATLANEITTSKYRLAMSFSITWCLSYAVVAGIAYATKSWRNYMLVINSLAVPVIFAFMYFGDSPRWLIAKGHYRSAAVVLNKISRLNKTSAKFSDSQLNSTITGILPKADRIARSNSNKLTPKSFLLIFQQNRLRMVTVLILFYQTVGTMFGNMAQFNLGDFFTSSYISFMLLGVLRIWVPFLIIYLDWNFPSFGRRRYFLFSFATVLVPFTFGILIAIVVSSQQNSHNTALEMIMTVSVLIAVSLNYGFLWFAVMQLTLEIYPTIVRNAAFSLANVATTVGAALGPQLIPLQNVWRPFPYCIMEGLMLICFLLGIRYFPETKGKPLPDNFHDLNQIL